MELNGASVTTAMAFDASSRSHQVLNTGPHMTPEAFYFKKVRSGWTATPLNSDRTVEVRKELSALCNCPPRLECRRFSLDTREEATTVDAKKFPLPELEVRCVGGNYIQTEVVPTWRPATGTKIPPPAASRGTWQYTKYNLVFTDGATSTNLLRGPPTPLLRT